MIKFKFSVFTRSFPGICLVSGLALTIISKLAGLGNGLTSLGVLLIFAVLGYMFIIYI